jgi:DNA-binding FadR family transcriptional regulator
VQVTTKNLSDHVAQHLMSYIRSHKLRSGDPVPSEVSVSSELGISRGIVREAYRGLRMAGILDIANGRTPRVGTITDGAIAPLLEHALATEQVTSEQVLDFRAAIEVRAAELAAANRTQKQADALQKEVVAMRARIDRHIAFADSDVRFHEVIGHATCSPLYSLVGGAIRGAMKASIQAGLRNRIIRAELDSVVTTHQRIADAICDRDAVQAREYMIIHFHEALRSFRRSREPEPLILPEVEAAAS